MHLRINKSPLSNKVKVNFFRIDFLYFLLGVKGMWKGETKINSETKIENIVDKNTKKRKSKSRELTVEKTSIARKYRFSKEKFISRRYLRFSRLAKTLKALKTRNQPKNNASKMTVKNKENVKDVTYFQSTKKLIFQLAAKLAKKKKVNKGIKKQLGREQACSEALKIKVREEITKYDNKHIENLQLIKGNEYLKNENEKLKKENGNINEKCEKLDGKNMNLKTENDILKGEKASACWFAKCEIEELESKVKALEKENQNLKNSADNFANGDNQIQPQPNSQIMMKENLNDPDSEVNKEQNIEIYADVDVNFNDEITSNSFNEITIVQLGEDVAEETNPKSENPPTSIHLSGMLTKKQFFFSIRGILLLRKHISDHF